MGEVPEVKRLFIGIPLPVAFVQCVREVKDKNAHIGKIRWTPSQNLHITLHFLGDTEEVEVKGVMDELAGLTWKFEPFELVFQKYTLAPVKRPYMIWATFLPNENFIQLSKALVGKFSVDARKLKKPVPHVTLARFKYLNNPHRIVLPTEREPLEIQVNTITLWESVLKPAGAQYTALQNFPLD